MPETDRVESMGWRYLEQISAPLHIAVSPDWLPPLAPLDGPTASFVGREGHA